MNKDRETVATKTADPRHLFQDVFHDLSHQLVPPPHWWHADLNLHGGWLDSPDATTTIGATTHPMRRMGRSSSNHLRVQDPEYGHAGLVSDFGAIYPS